MNNYQAWYENLFVKNFCKLELAARITREVSVTAGLGYTHIEFDMFEDALWNYEGNTVPLAPDCTFNVGTQ